MSSKTPKKSRSSRKTSKKPEKAKLTCQCCQRSVSKNAIPLCLSKVECHACMQCNKEVCPKCMKQNRCYICRLKNNDNTNSEAALKMLKKDSIKAISKRLGVKGQSIKTATEEQMIRQIVRRCELDGNARASQPSTSTSFKQDNDEPQAVIHEMPKITDKTTEEGNKDKIPGHTKPTEEFPLLENIQNEEQIRQMSIPQIRSFLKHYGKYDGSMNEKREFQELAIELWRKAIKIPGNNDANRKQIEQQQHQKPIVEIRVNQAGSEPNATKKRESFTLPAEGQADIPTVVETVQSPQKPAVTVPPLEKISGVDEIQSWSTKQLKAFLQQHGRYNKSWLEKNTLQYEAIKFWRTWQRNSGTSNGPQQPISTPEVQPKISITALPHLDHDNSDDSEEDQPKNLKLTTFQSSSQEQEKIHEENLDAKPKAVISEIPIQDEHQEVKKESHLELGGSLSMRLEDVHDYNNMEAFMGQAHGTVYRPMDQPKKPKMTTVPTSSQDQEVIQKANHDAVISEMPIQDEHQEMKNKANLEFGGRLSLRMEDFQDYDNMEAFLGHAPEATEELRIENRPASGIYEMASESMETSDSFVYMTPKNEDQGRAHRPASLPLKIPNCKKVGFHPVTEQISDSDSDEEAFSQAKEYREDLATGSHLNAGAGPSNFEVPMSPEEFFDTLREMEQNMDASSEFPDFTQAVRKRLSSDKSVEYQTSWTYQDDSNQNGMHTPEEFLGTVYSIKAGLSGSGNDEMPDDRNADISITAQRLSELTEALDEQGADSNSGIHQFKEAEAESGQTDMKAMDIPFIENNNEQVAKILKSKVQRPESWGVSMDEILSEENINKMKTHHLQLLLQKHGIKADWLDKQQLIQEVTKLWHANKSNRISMYEEAISEGEDSEGNISPDTEFAICSLPPLPPPPALDPQIINVTMKTDFTETDARSHDVHLDRTELPLEEPPVVLPPAEEPVLRKKKPEIPKKPPTPLTPTKSYMLGRTATNSAYLTFVMSEEEIENMEEYKLRAILRQARTPLKDIWKREDLIEEVIKVWKQEQVDRGRSLERAFSNSGFGGLNRSRKSSTESLQQEIDFDSIQSEKDLERLTSRNLQRYLTRNNLPIQGLLLHEHFLREAKKHWRSTNAGADDKPIPVKEQEQVQPPEVRLEDILSERQIESMSVEAIKAVLRRHGLSANPEEQKEDLVARLQVLWRKKTVNKEGHQEAAIQPPRTDESVYEKTIHVTESQEVHLNNGHQSTYSVSYEQHDEVPIELQGPPKPQRVSKIETLEDITSPEIIRNMGIRQIKELLSKHSVSYVGCQEKQEIIEKLETLWHDKKKHENQAIQPDDLCKICMCERIDCVLLECGHVTTCTACGHKITECPICRNYVTKVVRLYKS